MVYELFECNNSYKIYRNKIWTVLCSQFLFTLTFVFFSDVIRSVIGSVIWTAVIVTWVVIFQLKRAEWGASADYISFIIPRGEP